MALSGATDVKAHRRYLANTARARSVPEAALPRVSASLVLKPSEQPIVFFERETGFEPATPSLGSLCSIS